jgi:hypothetical protein
MMESRSYKTIQGSGEGYGRYGFDLYFKTVWCHEMFAWCSENLGPQHHYSQNPDGVWFRTQRFDSSHYTAVRFNNVNDAIAFKMRFL